MYLDKNIRFLTKSVTQGLCNKNKLIRLYKTKKILTPTLKKIITHQCVIFYLYI